MSCPICSKDTLQKYRPFCSKRCADLDLGKWMTGAYAVPSQGEDDAEELIEELDKALREDPEADTSKLH
jgi:endogenous inhibitor of DNA gyrase (YacG/DUF329 family)